MMARNQAGDNFPSAFPVFHRFFLNQTVDGRYLRGIDVPDIFTLIGGISAVGNLG